ncbi:MAG: DUF1015 family protein [Actinomycetota bacterium]
MPRFEPFHAARYALGSPEDITPLVSPPYDVFGEEERDALASAHPANIVRVDYPVERDGAGRYDACASGLAAWVADGTVRIDDTPSFTLYRMGFVDDAGRRRETVGVIGALEVVDEGAGGVLPHERTTPKAKTDRLDLTRATKANLSPVWGLSLTPGLSGLLEAPGETVARTTDTAGVVHTAERVTDPARVSAIASAVSSSPVLIADGHHRYAISRTYRDEQRAAGGTGASELVMTYVAELVAEQLSIAAIHRLVTGHSADEVLERIAPFYDTEAAGQVGPGTLVGMESSGRLCLVDRTGNGTWLAPRDGAFAGIRDMDSARLEHALGDLIGSVSYQHGVNDVLSRLQGGDADCAVLIRPVSLQEIRRTADTGELMPPKSTFFTPKLLTGMVWRPLAP